MTVLLGIVTESPTERRKRFKKKRKSWRTLVRWVIGIVIFLVVLFLFGFAFEYALDSPKYVIKNVEVDGLKATSKEILLKQAGLKIEGENYFDVSPWEIKRKLLALPSIKYCEIQKIFPDTVKIKIEEKIPFATLYIADNLYLIDHTAKVLKKIYSIKEKVGPIITGIESFSELKEGDYIDDEGLWGAMEFWYEFNQISKKVNLTISEIVVDSGSIKVFFNEIPCETRWKREELKSQIQKFTLAMKKIDIKKIPCYEYLDFRFGEDIVFR